MWTVIGGWKTDYSIKVTIKSDGVAKLIHCSQRMIRYRFSAVKVDGLCAGCGSV